MSLNNKGQLILTLILVMSVALVVGLSVIQRSIVDVSTSNKVEQSSRAFSAAEAGIEQALLRADTSGQREIPFDNSAKATVANSGLIPAIAAAGTRQDPLEFPPIDKEEVAHVWLANPYLGDPPNQQYNQDAIEVYWGNSDTDVPAIEMTFVYLDGTVYKSQKLYFDSPSVTRTPINNFTISGVTCRSSTAYFQLQESRYKCMVSAQVRSASTNRPILGRIRLLYNKSAQPIAFWGGSCGADCSLPPQARRITSTGKSGESQRKVRLFQQDKVVPPYFDFAIFSVGEIKK